MRRKQASSKARNHGHNVTQESIRPKSMFQNSDSPELSRPSIVGKKIENTGILDLKTEEDKIYRNNKFHILHS